MGYYLCRSSTPLRTIPYMFIIRTETILAWKIMPGEKFWDLVNADLDPDIIMPIIPKRCLIINLRTSVKLPWTAGDFNKYLLYIFMSTSVFQIFLLISYVYRIFNKTYLLQIEDNRWEKAVLVFGFEFFRFRDIPTIYTR